MKITNKGNLRILESDVGYILYNKKTDTYSEKVYLGIYGDIEDYEEIIDEKFANKLYDNIQSLNKKIEERTNLQNELIDINMFAVDEIFSLIEPLLLMSLSTEETSKMAELYVAMIKRGLKTLDEIPSKYRGQVVKLLEK